MGQGIALACATAGYATRLFDSNLDQLHRGMNLLRKDLSEQVIRGKISDSELVAIEGRIHPAASIDDVIADVVIEAIVENLDSKQQLLLAVEGNNSTTCVLCTNTSSLSVSSIASSLRRPDRFIGLHFFNPAHRMKLVEVISGHATNPEIIDVMLEFVKKLGKTAAVVKDSPGFIVNRVARPYYLESLRLLEDGVAKAEEVDILLRSAGFKMGAFELMDLIGIDINLSVTKSVYKAFNNAARFKPSRLQEEKVLAGDLGRKTGKGFYDYAKS